MRDNNYKKKKNCPTVKPLRHSAEVGGGQIYTNQEGGQETRGNTQKPKSHLRTQKFCGPSAIITARIYLFSAFFPIKLNPYIPRNPPKRKKERKKEHTYTHKTVGLHLMMKFDRFSEEEV